MKFGVYLYPPGGSGNSDDLVRLALGAERMQFDSVWLGDHVVWPAEFDPTPHRSNVGGRTPVQAVVKSNVFEPLTTLAFLAAKVERINLGVGVLVAPYRNPILCAKMLAMLDVLSGGRLIVGVGAGWLREEFTLLGAPAYEQRGDVTDEYLQSFIELWTAQEPRFEGRFGRFDGVELNPKPVQKPHPPIWIGGNGTPAMRRAARFGSGWMPLHQSPAAMAAKTRQLREFAEAGKRDSKELGVALGCRFRFADGAGHFIPDPDSLTGTKEQVIDQLRRYREAGVDQVYLLNDGYSTVEDLLSAWDRFASEVMINV